MKITPYTQSTLPAWLKMRVALFHDEDPKLLEEEVQQITKTNTLKSQPFQCLLAFDDSNQDTNPTQPTPIGFIELTIRSSAEECMTSPVLYPLN